MLYYKYERMTMEELFIFIPSVAFLPRRQALQVALLAPNTTNTKAKRVKVERGEV